MKAQEIMMFLLIFNLSLSLIGALHIYNLDVSVAEEKFNVSGYDAGTARGSSEGTNNLVWVLLGTSISAIAGGIIAGAMTSWLTRIPTDAGVAYGVFAGAFWGITLGASRTIWNIAYMSGLAGYNTAILMVIFIFLGVTGVVFIYGFVQLVKGGWKGYK